MGIIAKIWNVKAGSMGRSGGAQISSSIDYITNSEKCDGTLSLDSNNQVGREVSYVINDIKTLNGLYVGGRHITEISSATAEMMSVKEFYGKLDGRVALHGIVSLDEEESDKKNAGKLMLLIDELMERVFPDNQAVYAVHTNTENLHVHFVVNTVGLDGKKIHMDKNFMRKIFEPAVNELAIKYGFTPNEKWLKQMEADKISFKDRKIMLRKAIDLAIEESDDFTEFVKELRDMDIGVNVGKHLSLRMEGMQKAIRSGLLGDEYTIDAIKDRIVKKMDPFIELKMSNYVKSVEYGDIVRFNPTTLKKYKDMNADEKKEVIHMLKLGRNPWKERYEGNWQVQRMSDELNSRKYVYDIVKTYSENGSIHEAKGKIIELQKMISQERKHIKEHLKAYKPVISLYEEARKYEIRAYLYEFAGCNEYKKDYEEYKELCRRINDNYGKNICEVAEFIEDMNNELIYAKAQSNELSNQYKTIMRFEKQKSQRNEEKPVSFYEAVGHSGAYKQAKDYGIYSTRLVKVVADDVEDYSIIVLTTPEMIDGKGVIVTTVTVLDHKGSVIEEINSRNVNGREFNEQLNDIKYKYGFIKCYVMPVKDSEAVTHGRSTKR